MSAPPDLPALDAQLLGYGGPDDDPAPPDGGFAASVAVIVRPSASAPELLLIRRGEFERDPWSGHMAFPGGRREAEDRSLLDTAIRETREETGIRLDRAGRMLGRLESVAPISSRLPALSIVPFVFVVPGGTPAEVASHEVAAVRWVGVDHFLDPGSRTVHRYPLPGSVLTFPAFDLDGHPVWGLTHRILEDFLARLRAP